MLGEAQERGEYLGTFHMRFREDRPLLRLAKRDSDYEHGGRTPPPECNDAHDDVIVVPDSTGPS